MQQKAYVLMGHTHLDLHGLLQLRDALDSVSLLDAQMELSLQSHSEVLISLNLKYETSHAKTFLTVCRFKTVAVRKPFISRSNGMGCRSNGLSYPFKNN